MPEQLIKGYQRFREGYFRRNQDHLNSLAEGQWPRIAILSCCDSRVDPSVVFDAKPGELFVIRNVANLVPPCETEGLFHGTSAALEFAATKLLVSDIVVLGHAQCGGIRALMDRPEDLDMASFIDRWMTLAEPARLAAEASQQACSVNSVTGINRYVACEQLSIEHSLGNLMTFPWIKTRVQQGLLSVHGWYYDLSLGTLSRFRSSDRTFTPLC